MPARRSKKKDFSQIALDVVEAATGSELKPSEEPSSKKPVKKKNPAAVALGKLGASRLSDNSLFSYGIMSRKRSDKEG